MAVVKSILFDVGNVLLGFDHKVAAKQMASVTGLSLEEIWQKFFEGGLATAYESGAISTAEMIASIREISENKDFNDKALLNAAANIFTAKDDVMALATTLKHNGYRLVLLSNTCEAHWLYFSKAFPVFRLFDAATLSFEVKAMKPELKIFEDAIKKAGCKPEECFYTDDIAEYVTAGKKVGLRSHVFRNAETLRRAMEKEGIRVTKN